MKLVVGLGNPGRKYVGTRHNIGFAVLAGLASRHQADRAKLKYEAEVTEILLGDERVMLLAPQTYMNASGRSVHAAVGFFRLMPEDVLVICDDMNLPLGKLRLRKSGSAGGQKGLKNILDQLGTENVPRLRIGVGSPPAGINGADYVLRSFAKSELDEVDGAVSRSLDAVECWSDRGIDAAMNEFNVSE